MCCCCFGSLCYEPNSEIFNDTYIKIAVEVSSKILLETFNINKILQAKITSC